MNKWSRGSYFAMLHYKNKSDKVTEERNAYFKGLTSIANGTKPPAQVAREVLYSRPVKPASKRIKTSPLQLRLL